MFVDTNYLIMYLFHVYHLWKFSGKHLSNSDQPDLLSGRMYALGESVVG